MTKLTDGYVDPQTDPSAYPEAAQRLSDTDLLQIVCECLVDGLGVEDIAVLHDENPDRIRRIVEELRFADQLNQIYGVGA